MVRRDRNMSSSVCDESANSSCTEVNRGHLVIACTENVVRIGILVDEPSDDLALVHGEWSNLEVLLPDKDWICVSIQSRPTRP